MLHAYDRSGPFRAFVLAALLVAGAVMWLHSSGQEFVYGAQYYGLLACFALAGVALVWPRPFAAGLGRFWRHRHFSRRTRALVAGGCLLVGGLLPLCLALSQDANFQPTMCDEYSYLTQAQLLSHGRLWSRGHELPDFFNNFQVVAAPVYGSIYFPGTALWVLPWVMAAGPGMGWAGSLLALAIATALAYLVTAELVDDWAALAVVAVMEGAPGLRAQSLMVLGQVPAAMFGLAVIFAYLRWRKAAGARGQGLPRAMLAWAVLAGAAAAWGMLTRPVDLLAYALPVVLLVLLARVPARRRLASLAAALIGVAPFAAMQLPFNKAVTGSYLQTPFSWYADKYIPGTGYELGERSQSRVPPQAMPNFQLSYRTFALPFVRESNLPLPERAYIRARRLFVSGLPHGLMLLVMPAALPLLLRRPRLWLLAAPLPLALLLYLPYGFFLSQYAAAVVPSMAAWMVLGACELVAAAVPFLRRPFDGERRGRPGRLAPALALVFVGGMLALSTRGIPGLASLGDERWYQVPELRHIDAALADLPGRALVFISPPSLADPIEAEPTYNLDVPFPDDARVVRAHDLGGRNVELIDYYARLQPEREAYRFDRDADALARLGNVADLSARPKAALREEFRDAAAWWRDAYRSALDGYDSAQSNEPQ